ncbi:hypothetical protein GW17_00030431 [Ensete ventricosum]|nr:hypothetical protein GW17_00030431 [Ensete ventricosum]
MAAFLLLLDLSSTRFFHSCRFVRLLVFTLEVAISSMSRFVDQFVILFDASMFDIYAMALCCIIRRCIVRFLKLSDARTCTKNAGLFRSAPAFLNLLMGTLKIIFDYYPGRLHKAFVVDPPSLFSYLWKVRCQGVRPFVELSVVTAVVSSLDFDDSIEDAAFASCRTRAASLRFDPVVAATARLGGSTSSRFSFTVSHLDSLKPWYLSTTTRATPRAVMPTASPSLVGASPLNARSFSFASPAARYTPRASRSIPSTPCSFPPPKHPNQQQQQTPRTPRPSFLQSPATLFTFWKEGQAVVSRGERERESFLPFLRFYRRPYDEMAYRSKMRSPLGGLVSIISPHLKQQQLQ